MNERIFLNFIEAQSLTVFELLAIEDNSLLIRRNALSFLNLFLQLLDRVSISDANVQVLTSQRLDCNNVTDI